MNIVKTPLIYILCILFGLFSTACFAGRYDTHPGSLGWIVYGNFITLGVVWYFARIEIKEHIENDWSLYGLYQDWLFIAWIIVCISVVLAWFNLPSNFYIYIHRPILFIASIIAIFQILSSRNNHNAALLLMAFFAFIYNPIMPVVLGTGTKWIWVILNLIFIVSIFLIAVIDEDSDNEAAEYSDDQDETEEAVEPEISEDIKAADYIDVPITALVENKDEVLEKADAGMQRVIERERKNARMPNEPDVGLILQRNIVARIRANISLIIPLLEIIENSEEKPIKEIKKLIDHIGGEIRWSGEGSIVSINNVERSFYDYKSLKIWIGTVLTKRLLEYVS